MENPREIVRTTRAGPNWPAGARLPIPGNAEWVWWAVMAIVVAIVALAISDRVDAAAAGSSS